MDNKSVVTIIAWCCFYLVVKTDDLCSKIHQKKGYMDTMKKVHAAVKQINKIQFCSDARKLSNFLLNDADALMCTKYLISYLQKHELMNKTRQFCGANTIGYTDMFVCKSVDEFDRCIRKNMPFSLKRIANVKDGVNNPCQLCNEFPFLVKCACNSPFLVTCPKVFTAMKNVASTRWCKICETKGGTVKVDEKPECCRGKYGEQCLNTCNCVDYTSCHKETGRCPRGCHHRYDGVPCQKKCKSGYYLKGKTCEGKCLCKNADQCVVTNGTCLDGQCVAGYVEKDRVCTLFNENGTIPVYVDDNTAEGLSHWTVIFIVLGVTVFPAALLVIFAALYMRAKQSKVVQREHTIKVCNQNVTRSPSEFFSRFRTSNAGRIANNRGRVGSTTTSAPMLGQHSLKGESQKQKISVSLTIP